MRHGMLWRDSYRFFSGLTATVSVRRLRIRQEGPLRSKRFPTRPQPTRSRACSRSKSAGHTPRQRQRRFSTGDRAAFNALIDCGSLFGKALSGLGLPDNRRQQFMDELKLTTRMGSLVNELRAVRLVRLGYLRTRQNHGQRVILLRLDTVKVRTDYDARLFPGKPSMARPVPSISILMRAASLSQFDPPRLTPRCRQRVAEFSSTSF